MLERDTDNKEEEQTNMHPFEFLEPTNVAEACRLLSERAGKVRLLAGGTDLLIQMEMGRHRPETILSMARLPGLDELDWDGRRLTIGARVTLRQIELHPVV